jgi:hypothetical protein
MNKPKKKSWLDYLIYVIWGLIFVSMIYEIPISLSNSIIWFIGLFLAVLVYYKINLPKWLYFGALLILFANASGEIISGFFFANSSAGFFYTVQNYDKILHLLDPLIICPLIYYLLKEKIENKKILILISVALLLSFELIWEIWEYFSDLFLGTHLQGVFIYVKDSLGNLQLTQTMSPLTDTIYDMLDNLIGSLIWAAGALFFTRKKK